jgi:hypothetical protein
MSYSDEDILEGARAIRPHLKELLGEEAGRIDDELGKYLDLARKGQRVENLIIEMLAEHDATRQWMDNFLASSRQPEASRSYSNLPGFPQSAPVMQRYACSDCGHIWFRRSAGEEIPVCPIHHKQLVLVKSPKKS